MDWTAEEKAAWPEGHKECTDCRKVKPLNEFHKQSSGVMGRTSKCGRCRSDIMKDKRSRDIPHSLLYGAKVRAEKKGIPFELDIEDIVVPDVCPVLLTPFTKGNTDTAASLDRLDASKGYVKGNVNVISRKANRIKNNASVGDLQRVVAWMVEASSVV
jgi:hypothetical protein